MAALGLRDLRQWLSLQRHQRRRLSQWRLQRGWHYWRPPECSAVADSIFGIQQTAALEHGYLPGRYAGSTGGAISDANSGYERQPGTKHVPWSFVRPRGHGDYEELSGHRTFQPQVRDGSNQCFQPYE